MYVSSFMRFFSQESKQCLFLHSRYPKFSPDTGSSRNDSHSTDERPVGLQPSRGAVAGTGWAHLPAVLGFSS